MRDRLPSRHDVVQVFAVLWFAVAGWTFDRFSWQFASWSNFLDVETLVGILAYRIAASLLESLIILAFLLVLCLIFPPKYLKENFTAKGTIFVLILCGSLFGFWNLFNARSPGVIMADYAALWLICTVVIALLIAHFSVKIKKVSAIICWISDRMTVFLYLLVPITASGFVIILVRNIF